MYHFRSTVPAPTPFFPQTLSQFGFCVREHRLVDSESGARFEYYHTSDESVNRARKEAFHQVLRQEILRLLRQQGLTPVFLAPQPPDLLAPVPVPTTKPESTHTFILATNLDLLRRSRDVVVVVGEDSQDPGIWSWREITCEGTLEQGSALGLLPTLKTLLGDSKSPPGTSADVEELHIPALIILNPGQTLYSHKLSRPVTLASWNDCHFDTVTQSGFAIHNTENRIAGHANDFEHLETCFESVLPQLLDGQCRVHIIGIGKGCEAVLKVLDSRISKTGRALENDLMTVALVEPTHDPQELRSTVLRDFLRMNARSWIRSDKEKNELLGIPDLKRDQISQSTAHIEVTGSDGVVADPVDCDEPQGYVYEPDQFSCDTYSAGVSSVVTESVFPRIQKDVLAFVCERMYQSRSDRENQQIEQVSLNPVLKT